MENLMISIGLAFVVFWALIEAFALAVTKAAIVTGVLFVILGLLIEGVPQFKRSP